MKRFLRARPPNPDTERAVESTHQCHHRMLPQPIEVAQKVINIGRKIREQHNKSLKQVRAPRGAQPRPTRSHIYI